MLSQLIWDIPVDKTAHFLNAATIEETAIRPALVLTLTSKQPTGITLDAIAHLIAAVIRTERGTQPPSICTTTQRQAHRGGRTYDCKTIVCSNSNGMGFSKLADLDKHVSYSIRIGNTAGKFLTATTMAEIDLGRRKP
jgi:hypothetical protein